ncbi:MAG: NAD-glutamate dehydrogenase [Methylomonas sp.]|jgi:glutamate dehydrogenase|uniref:NAD-glutamate dehydrogenase domain-containing protein n=1 Tax=Methylomonas sp. TaxID=418 RepID=UPI0025E41325|nr:NAD-glutamate dehydrogenase domain-containing protein [Methylomonas sp.]MCK9608558.1 NAD-glutamate dehydrogenase [Methylomonas sp.]
MRKPTRSWLENLKIFTEKALGKPSGTPLVQKYSGLFPPDYQALVSPRYALNDILHLERLTNPNHQAVSLIKPCANHPHFRLHFYSHRERYLDEFIPILENMNLRVIDQVQFGFSIEGVPATIKSFTIKAATEQCESFNTIKEKLLETIQAVMAFRVENDALNKLVIMTAMDWRACDVLRTYRNYYLQLEHRTTKDSIHHALINNSHVTKALYDYFEARFRPNPDWQDSLIREEQVLFPLRLHLLESMASVSNINDDRILRTLFNLIDATVRSNFHQRCLLDDYFIAIKVHSLGVIDMPAPKPQYEIYVHSVDMEGIHLRGGKVSRGGIRWSDRIDDFRTEILDLMQTQVSKNALIIPTGAKGGFVVKNHGGKHDFKEAGKRAYLTLMRGLLDLTDNYHDDAIVTPPGIVVHDDPDPYLVVAADKGTAKFSDIANGVAAEYHFWLGDAFASGGSRGYDHKALGITARGAWECVRRHFRELGKDIQNEPFTVIGVGSMDGDVFGNGMLLSPCIRLLAAFSGQHVFIDPNPPATDEAFKERQRLFQLPGSSWDDYDRKLISHGGGVYMRTDKDIPVSAEIKKWLGIRYKSIDAESLIQHLLKAPVELLWLGGIGTYVKASAEKPEDVGDRGNDHVRVDAGELGAMVVGEGANLGFTQKARIEYSLTGGRINTDAVDNSAGVDTSDHEVNLKILLTRLHKKHLVEDYQSLFIGMTEAVCRLVLADNYAQSLCLSLEQQRSTENPAAFMQVADRLEAAGFLDRAVESFPQSKEIQARAGQVITRPELAVLMSASKMYLTEQIQSQLDILENDCCEGYLQAYFPTEFTDLYQQHLSSHPLANEIKATMISNYLVNQAGCSFLSQDDDIENGSTLAYVKCYLTFDRVLKAQELRTAIYQLDNIIPASSQYQLLLQIENTLSDFSHWAVLHHKSICPDVETVECYNVYLNIYAEYLKQQTRENQPNKTSALESDCIPVEIAEKLEFIAQLNDFPFMVSLAITTQQDLITILKLLVDINQTFGLNEIEKQLTQIPRRDYWVKTVCNTLQADIHRFSAKLAGNILNSQAQNCSNYIQRHINKAQIKYYRKIYLENQKMAPVNLLAYITLIRAFGNMLEI